MQEDLAKADNLNKAMIINSNLQKVMILGILVSALGSVGCRQSVATAPAPVTATFGGEFYQPEAVAGVELKPEDAFSDMETVQQLASRRSWDNRNDPFRLLSAESNFDRQQMMERVLSDGGGYKAYFEEPVINYELDRPVVEPTPAWRLSGVAVSEGAVLALLDTGSSVELIRPGSQVPGTDWTCVSIDEQRAVFRRSGNQLPREITIPLAGREGSAGGGNQGGGGGNGRPSLGSAGGGGSSSSAVGADEGR